MFYAKLLCYKPGSMRDTVCHMADVNNIHILLVVIVLWMYSTTYLDVEETVHTSVIPLFYGQNDAPLK